MMGLRNLYKVFNESRKVTRRRTTIAVTGASQRANAIAAHLDAQRDPRDAEIVLNVHETGNTVTISGKHVDHPNDIELTATDAETLDRQLLPKLAGALDKDYLVAVARAHPVLRQAACEEMIRNNARENAFIGALPIPGADMPVMTANQGRMVLSIAAAYGEDLTLERARELIGVLAAGLGLRALTRQVIKLIPFGGWAASAAMGYAGTIAMGRATILYFERGANKLGEQEMINIRNRAAEEGRAFVSRWRESRKKR
jgi:uncharacterized protein (DUF697 family)